MPSEVLRAVMLESGEAVAWSRALPGDFLPAPPEMAAWFRGEDSWCFGRFPGAAGSAPLRLEDIRSPEDLPPGLVLLRPLGARIAFTAPVPFGMDLHWLKEVSEGLLRGTTGVRVHSAGTATIQGEWEGEWLTAAAREDCGGEPGLRVAVIRRASGGAGAAVEGAWEIRARAGRMADPREVAAGLIGVHPLHWVRGLLKELGSRRVEEFVTTAGSTLRTFDALREFWQRMGSRAEAALWELLKSPPRREALASLVAEMAGAEDAVETVLERLAGKAARWLPAGVSQQVLHFLAELAGGAAGSPEPAVLIEKAREVSRLLERDGAQPLLQALSTKAERECAGPGGWSGQRIGEMLGGALQSAGQALWEGWIRTAQRLGAPAGEAVAKQWSLRLAAAMSGGGSQSAAADATFRFTPEGLDSAARVARGDLSPLFEERPALLRLRRGTLAETFERRFFVEVHVPMLRARRKQRDLTGFASAEATVTEDGRIQIRYSAQAADTITADLRAQTAMVFSAALSACDGEAGRDHFSLSFTDRRQLDPAVSQAPYQRVLSAYGLEGVALPGIACSATLHLRLPGRLVEAWMDTPSPGSPEYLPAMSRVAYAVQMMARRWLPALYLARIEAYSRPSAVHPLMAWSCSPPSSGPKKKDLSYDFMDPKVVDTVLQASAPGFRERLEETWRFLSEAGRKQTAAYYEPADTRYILANVKRQQRNFVSLLTADAFLVEAVLNTADCAREVDRLVRVAPKAAVTEMARFAREMAETFHRKLRRLYAGEDFLALGPLFFLTATGALAGSAGAPAEVAAVLTLEWSGGKASYANEAARRLL